MAIKIADMLSKQPLTFIVTGLFLAAWVLCGRSLALQEHQGQLRAQIARVNDSVEQALATIASIQKLEQEADFGRSEIKRWESGFPATDPLVWLPPRIKEHFSHYGFAAPVTRLDKVQEDPELLHYQRYYWRIRLPLDERTADLRNLLSAVGEFEEVERVAKVIDVAIQPDPLNPSGRAAVITVATLLRN